MRWVRGPAVLLAGLAGCNAVFGLDPSSLVEADGGSEPSGRRADAATTARDASGAPGSSGSGSVGGSGNGGTTGAPATSGSASGSGSGSTSGSTSASAGSGQVDADGGPDGSNRVLECSAACSTGLACERNAGPTCADPNWAEWPVANAAQDVTAGAPNPHQYTDNLNGTVTDNVTELIWQQAIPPGTYTQPDAVTYCHGLGLTGHHDWRLPSEIELISIVDHDVSNPSIDSTYFPDTPALPFWSATRLGVSTTVGWGVTFIFGSVGSNDMSSTNYVRCVR